MADITASCASQSTITNQHKKAPFVAGTTTGSNNIVALSSADTASTPPTNGEHVIRKRSEDPPGGNGCDGRKQGNKNDHNKRSRIDGTTPSRERGGEGNSNAGSAGDGDSNSGKKKKIMYPVKQMKIQLSTRRKRTPRNVLRAEIYPKYRQLTCIMMHWYQMGTLIQPMYIKLWGTRSKLRMKWNS
jgi:hypothetical protein